MHDCLDAPLWCVSQSGALTIPKLACAQNNVDTVRSFVGVCPQTDIIFELLTAVEHVELFAGLKGNPVTREEAIELLQEVSLDLKQADEMATGATQ